MAMPLSPEFDPSLLSRIETAGLSASAPPQQQEVDGWLLRLSAGKAKRARCINALAAGHLPIGMKLAQCKQLMVAAGLPLLVRITPFSQPPELDQRLAEWGMVRIDDTRVMVRTSLAGLPAPALPPNWRLAPLAPEALAELVGDWRGSPPAHRQAHAERLRSSKAAIQGFAWQDGEGDVAACGHIAVDDGLVGLYDVFTAEPHRGQGLATALCLGLLHRAASRGATAAYLQVDADNAAARAVYHRLGFVDGYGYHYRGEAEPGATAQPRPVQSPG